MLESMAIDVPSMVSKLYIGQQKYAIAAMLARTERVDQRGFQELPERLDTHVYAPSLLPQAKDRKV